MVNENKNHLLFSISKKLKIMNGGANEEGENSKKLLLTAGLYNINIHNPNKKLRINRKLLSVLSLSQ
tara:strand:+ start:641 stop:841 length:201 start_codon:yes stop_codon:yes gene_type:complete